MFKKGVSGNPKGRPKGTKKQKPPMSSLESELRAYITASEDGRKIRITKEAAVIKLLFKEALAGDKDALKLLIKLRYPQGMRMKDIKPVVESVNEQNTSAEPLTIEGAADAYREALKNAAPSED